MFEYMTAQEAAELWEISVRRVQRLCKENRIEGKVIFILSRCNRASTRFFTNLTFV